MAGTKSKSQTQVSERQVPADSAPTARRARMQRLGTYQLQGPSSDENRLAPVAEIASKAYEIMNKEREGAAVVVHNDANAVEEPKVGVNPNPPAPAPAPKPPKAPATPKSESEVKRLAEQKKARAEQSKRDKAKNKAVKEATQKVESGEVRPGVTEPLASEVGTEPKK